MNIAITPLCALGGDPLPKKYHQMFPMLAYSLHKNLRGMDAHLVVTTPAPSFHDMLYRQFCQIRELTSAGHAVMLFGCDQLVIQPTEFPSADHMILWSGHMPHQRSYRQNGSAFFPPHLPDDLWDVGDRTFHGGRAYDQEQLAMTAMYFAQPIDHDADWNPAMNYTLDWYKNVENELYTVFIMHFDASRPFHPVEHKTPLTCMTEVARRFDLIPPEPS